MPDNITTQLEALAERQRLRFSAKNEDGLEKSVRSVLDYCPLTGVFHWVANKRGTLRSKIAGSRNSQGYIKICVGGKKYAAHRLAFLFMEGFMPKVVDHKNGIKSDNRWTNLREASPSQNQQNKPVAQNNSSGTKGVHFHKKRKKWQVIISGKYLGSFSDLEDAVAVCEKHRETLHGSFCNHGRYETEQAPPDPEDETEDMG